METQATFLAYDAEGRLRQFVGVLDTTGNRQSVTPHEERPTVFPHDAH